MREERKRSAIASKTPTDTGSHRYRLLLVSSHPVQYAAPIFRLLARHPRVDAQVAYCSMKGVEAHLDPDFKIELKWDIPLLDGYRWVAMPNRALSRQDGSFFNLVNPRVWRLIRSRAFDVVVLYTGYTCVTFWIALLAAKCSGVAVLFGTDAHNLAPRDRKGWKLRIKKLLWPGLFRLADTVIVPSSAGKAFMSSLGIRDDRVVVTPYCVNNEWWIEHSARVNRSAVRARWGIPEKAVVVVFSAKLQPWKRPMDLLLAFTRIRTPNTFLIFVGEGPLRSALETFAKASGVDARVRFLGFINQSGLPEAYTASDILVLPSEYEPFGVVVNEAMLCGCCAVVSDRVGARFDLVRNGETGYIFRAGDVDGLTAVLEKIASEPEDLQRIGRAARTEMTRWSPSANIDNLIEAVERSVQRRICSL